MTCFYIERYRNNWFLHVAPVEWNGAFWYSDHGLSCGIGISYIDAHELTSFADLSDIQSGDLIEVRNCQVYAVWRGD